MEGDRDTMGKNQRFPLLTFFVVVVLCLVLRENFPFSHYPMYSSFSDYTYATYLADGEGNPLPVEEISSVRTSALKKNFGTNLKAVEKAKKKAETWKGFRHLSMEERRPAGDETLRWLIDTSKNDHVHAELNSLRPLRLYMIEIHYEDGMIMTDEPALVGELP